MKVRDFHAGASRDGYGEHEQFVYHNEFECEHGQEIRWDGNDAPGRGETPDGKERSLCERCCALELAELRRQLDRGDSQSRHPGSADHERA